MVGGMLCKSDKPSTIIIIIIRAASNGGLVKLTDEEVLAKAACEVERMLY